jgi:hypothetical protein
MFHRAEQERAKTATTRLDGAKSVSLQQSSKKLLREFARGVFVTAFAA